MGAEEPTNRRLAAVLAADMVGYSRRMADDEVGTLAALKGHRENEFNPAVARHRGRIVKLIGDGTLVEFSSVVDAVNCAVDIQDAVRSAAPPGSSIVLRIGINLGDVIIDDDDIYGDGVNIAARLEPLARPGGICISSIVNESVRGRIKTAFADGGEVRVKNIDRPIRIWQWHPDDASPASGASAASATTQIEQPTAPVVEQEKMPVREPGGEESASIAVLPFENMSGDAEQEYFSDGISEDIITDLSKVSGLLVIARNSSFSYKGKSVDLRTVGRELGVGAVLEGSVRKAGNRVRITAQLIDAATGGHVWAERYDRDLTDIFAVQDEVTLSIVNALKVTLKPHEAARITGDETSSLEAHDCYLRGHSLIHSPNVTAQMYYRALDYVERAIEFDSGYARAYALLAVACVYDYFNRWSDDPDAAIARAEKAAARAVELDPSDPAAYHSVSLAASVMREKKKARAAIDKALSLDPNYARALFSRGVLAVVSGQPMQSIPDIERAMRLDPGATQQYLHYLGLAHLLLGNDETAALMFRERLLLAKDSDISRAMLAATLGHLGEIEEAQQLWRDLMKVHPSFSIGERLARLPFDNPSDTDRIHQGLAKAGLADKP